MNLTRWAGPLAGGIVAALLFLPDSAAARCDDFVPGPKPQNTSRDFVGHDLDTILDRGWMAFAVYEDYPPYSWEDGSTPRGVDIEIGQLIAESIGVEARFMFVSAAENLEADLRNHVWKGPLIGGRVANVMLHVPYDSDFACRVEQVVFTGQAYGESIAIAYDQATYPDEKPVPAYFRFDTVGVENDTISDFYLSALGRGQLRANIRRYPSYTAAMEALTAGEVKAVMGPRAELEHRLTDAIGLHEPPLPGFGKGSWTLGVAVHQAYRPLSYSVDAAIEDALADGQIEQIFADHGLTFTKPVR
ncbi:MAG: transporter substrate-binding domain-containing protein [Pseudomonadota bacterium]